MPDYLPLPVPDLAGKIKPQGTDLTEPQQEKYEAVLKHFDTEDYRLPGTSDDEGKLTEVEKFWLSYECLLRYLRAVKWASADAAIKRLEATLAWRREYGWYDRVSAEHVEPESITGKADVFGFDVDGRPALYLTPSKQNTEESPRQVEFTFFLVEKLIDLMGPGVETLALMINFADRSKNPSIQTSRTVLDILQSHYPERLGRAFIINIPFLIGMFLKFMLALVDPVTRAKVFINPSVREEGLFEADQVKKQFGGDREFEYNHEQYWPELLRMSEERKSGWMAKWREMGGKIGLKEWDYKGGVSALEVGDAEKNTVTVTESTTTEVVTNEKVAAAVEEVPIAEPSATAIAA